ncbi:hypothetical protein [Streptomyces sp. NPDC058657]|uniref:hypothetical protein n=1 Tax=unclassified Streptomyces TaxID=2593676 RepID=UPI00365D6AC1
MATPHPLTAMALDSVGLARWALGRMAAAAAEDVRFAAAAEYTQHRVPDDLSGRYGAHSVGRFTEADAVSSARLRIYDESSARLRRDDDAAGDPLLSLCDPARLVSGVAAASAGKCTWDAGRPCVDVTLVPHPWTADPQDPWLPPGVTRLIVGVDMVTGLLLHARAYDANGCFRSGRLRDLHDLGTTVGAANREQGAAFVLARMATTLLDPARLRAEVTAVPEILGNPTLAGVPSGRTWAVTLRGGESTLVDMSGDYEPDQTDPAGARLAELLTPARIVSHLADVTASGPASIEATVRPMRTFPFSAWAPEDNLTCHFTVDPTTGILLRAHTMAGPQTVARYEVTTHRAG